MTEYFVCVKDFEDYAYSTLPKNILNHFKPEGTITFNKTAFSKYKIRPYCLRNVANRNLSTIILGKQIKIPIGISPTSFQKIVHPDGECASAKAAQALGTIFILSASASSSIEEIAQAAPNGNNWLQLYIYNDRSITKNLVERAEKARFTAIVVTVDTPLLGSNKLTLPTHLKFSNFVDPKISKNPNHLDILFDPTVHWNDIKWLKNLTNLPIVAKGILTAEDAILAVNAGVDAILISNSRNTPNSILTTIDVLPEIVKAVGNQVEIYLEGGVREGIDVFKALALGAQMVFISRPVIWGLAHSGEEGVKKILTILKSEFESTLGMTGCREIKNIDPKMVMHESHFNKL